MPISPVVRPLISAALLSASLGFAVPAGDDASGFWTPPEPPRARYVIDVRLDPAAGTLEGTETIEFKNGARRPIAVVAVEWAISPERTIAVSAAGRRLDPENPENLAKLPSPLYFRLPRPASPGERVRLEVDFRQPLKLDPESASFVTSRFHPALWWDGRPAHGAYSVGIKAPAGYALAVCGRLDPKTGRYEAPAARACGLFLGRGMNVASREVDSVLVTTVATEKGAKAAAVCLEAAGNVIKFAKSWLGFYPFAFLNIVPGGSGRWGGYPAATGIVVIHGLETYKDGEPPLWWQWITAHEIGHEYWGEWVPDTDDPAWLWIAMGIFLDTEYLTTSGLDPDRRRKWMGNYLNGLRSYYDLTVDVPPALAESVRYDRNNIVVHSKCPSIIFALDSLLGRPAFERIYKKCLAEFCGRGLGWKDFQAVCERETGLSLAWFFDQWVRSNSYLCTTISARDSRPRGAGFLSTVTVRRLGTMKMPVPVRAIFEDGSEQTRVTERGLDADVLTFESRARLKEAVLDPEKKLAMLDEPLPPISPGAARALAHGWAEEDCTSVYGAIRAEKIPNPDIWYRLGTELYGLDRYDAAADCFDRVAALEHDGLYKFGALGWLGLLDDLRGRRDQAVARYREALRYDTGQAMRHDQFRITMGTDWLKQRLETPFSKQGPESITTR